MSPKELEMWKERLDYCNWLWRESGFTGEGPRSVMQYMNAYAGKYPQLEGWGGLDIVPVNTAFSVINTLMAHLSARNPETVLTPRRAVDTSALQGARINEIVCNYYIDELRMKREWDRALRDALILGAGFVRHGFTPAIEKYSVDGEEIEVYQQAHPDLPWIRRIPVWDIRVDPTAETWYPNGDAKYVFFRSFLSMRQIRENPNLKEREDLAPTTTLDKRYVMQSPKRDYQGPEDLELVETWTCYDKTDRKWFTLATGADKPIRDPDDYPIDYEDLPYDFLGFNLQPGEQQPISYLEEIMPLLEERIKLRTLMSELVKRSRRIIPYDRQAFEESAQKRVDFNEHLAEFLPIQNGADPRAVMAEIKLGGFDQTLLLYDALITQDIRETVQQSLMERGQRINVETATEAAGVRMGAATGTGYNQEAFEEFLSDIVRHFHQGLQSPNVVDQDLLVKIVGPSDAQLLRELGDKIFGSNQDFIRVSPDDLHGEFRYKIRVGSTLPEDHDREMAKLLALKQATADDPTVDRRALNQMVFEAAGLDSSRLMMSEEQQQQQMQQMAMESAVMGNGKKGTGGDIFNAVRTLGPQATGK